MPIVLNAPAQNPYDLAGLTAQIVAHNQQARANAAQLAQQSNQNLAQAFGNAANIYSHAKLQQQQQEMQNQREREAQRERRALHDEDALARASEFATNTLLKTQDDWNQQDKEGLDFDPKLGGIAQKKIGELSSLMAGEFDGTPSQRAKALLAKAQEVAQIRRTVRRPDEEPIVKPVPGIPGLAMVYGRRGQQPTLSNVPTDPTLAARRAELQHHRSRYDHYFGIENDPTKSASTREDARRHRLDIERQISALEPSSPSAAVAIPETPFGAGFDPSTPQSYDDMLAQEMALDAGFQQPVPARESVPSDEPTIKIDENGEKWLYRPGFPREHKGTDQTKTIKATNAAAMRLKQEHDLATRATVLQTIVENADDKYGPEAIKRAQTELATIDSPDKIRLKAKLDTDEVIADAERKRSSGAADTGPLQPLELPGYTVPRAFPGMPGQVSVPMNVLANGLNAQPTPAERAPLGQAPTSAAKPVSVTPKLLDSWKQVAKKTNDPRINAMIDLAVKSDDQEIGQAVDVVMKSLASDKPPAPGSKEYYLLAHAVRRLETSGVDVTPKPSAPPAETFWDRVGSTPQPF